MAFVSTTSARIYNQPSSTGSTAITPATPATTATVKFYCNASALKGWNVRVNGCTAQRIAFQINRVSTAQARICHQWRNIRDAVAIVKIQHLSGLSSWTVLIYPRCCCRSRNSPVRFVKLDSARNIRDAVVAKIQPFQVCQVGQRARWTRYCLPQRYSSVRLVKLDSTDISEMLLDLKTQPLSDLSSWTARI